MFHRDAPLSVMRAEDLRRYLDGTKPRCTVAELKSSATTPSRQLVVPGIVVVGRTERGRGRCVEVGRRAK